MNLNKISDPITEELKEFENQFSGVLKSKVALIDLITKYILRQKGKKIRPILVLLSAKLCGEINSRTYVAANLVELLHTATLIHDDVVDDAKTRRGIASINAVWKNKVSVLIGDYLLSKGLLLSLENNEYDFLQLTSEAVRRMSEGELLQIQKARNFDATEETYFRVISDKTASLIKTCCKLGALSTAKDKTNVDKLGVFGENIGIAFQIRDDILDYTGRKKLLGKSTGNDLKEKKFTLPLIVALRNAPKKRSAEIMKLIKSDRTRKFDEVYEFVIDNRGVEYAADKVIEYSDKAKNSLSDFKESNVKNSLVEFADFVSKREY
ncbi:MAG: polyprenyl synthetase family protein [Ignavibacteria bacterium]|nr:polyprenyl synthetase family protein [Ignavibacteria bacterium]MBK7157176.1 polyprenyl synthetase family protein [Ignavibacteria bacterium]MBK7256114.1 polyprenyl synthetase family protein [Ignavibacteria bacterium]MBK7444663.1 polyprenyl synthetase family protein [Ignavibacteria bacterium]MBK9403650.1 polyprenyl synthetase family protein [Ignavibacteria bacterium]